MYLHLGAETILPIRDIVAIINLASANLSEINKEFIQVAELERVLEKVSDSEQNKTCVITGKKVYLTSISASTVAKRMANYGYESKD